MLAEAGRCYAPLNLDFLLGQERISMLNIYDRAVVVAQLAERLLPIPEDPGSNPVIGNFYMGHYLLLTVCRKDENKEKEAGNGPFF